jgi:Glu-tRNA(Gln) amidotransferase subunit E-like FAD-binding protein
MDIFTKYPQDKVITEKEALQMAERCLEKFLEFVKGDREKLLNMIYNKLEERYRILPEKSISSLSKEEFRKFLEEIAQESIEYFSSLQREG